MIPKDSCEGNKLSLRGNNELKRMPQTASRATAHSQDKEEQFQQTLPSALHLPKFDPLC